jgi:hypothetical protein
MPSHSHFLLSNFALAMRSMIARCVSNASSRFSRFFSGPFELWLQSLKGPARDAATNALPAMRHEEIDVVGSGFPIAGLTSGGK